MTRLVALGLAGIVAVAAFAPASAATRRHHVAPAHSETMDEATIAAPVAARPGLYGMPQITGYGPNACVSDEGYGRYSSCDSGTSN